ncbi:PaaI family thioesterase [Gordonia iterans]
MKPVFELPANPEPMELHPKAPAPGEPLRLHHGFCYGCGDDAPVGLRLKVFVGEGFRLTAEMAVEPWMQGGPGVIHGGILAAAFDELMGTAPLLIGVPPVTGHLEVDFAEPIPLGSVLKFDAEVVAKERRKVFVRSTAHLADPARPVASAHGIFIAIDVRRHFAAYKENAVT